MLHNVDVSVRGGDWQFSTDQSVGHVVHCCRISKPQVHSAGGTWLSGQRGVLSYCWDLMLKGASTIHVEAVSEKSPAIASRLTYLGAYKPAITYGTFANLSRSQGSVQRLSTSVRLEFKALSTCYGALYPQVPSTRRSRGFTRASTPSTATPGISPPANRRRKRSTSRSTKPWIPTTYWMNCEAQTSFMPPTTASNIASSEMVGTASQCTSTFSLSQFCC
jgi:hypothetical protein